MDEQQFLKMYDPQEYQRPSVTVDTLIFTVTNKQNDDIRKLDEKELKVLLIKRKTYPFKGEWAFPGGFVGIEESLDDAADRIIKEKANISDIYFEQLYTYGNVLRDPRMRVLSVAYMALIPSEKLKPALGRDVEDIQWFTIKKKHPLNEQHKWIMSLTSEDGKTVINYEVNEKQIRRGVSIEKKESINRQPLGRYQLAFDHAKMLLDAVNRLKHKVNFTPIVFNLVGELFTRSEVQGIYEVLLDKKLTRTELWRKIKDMVVETEFTLTEKGHRPSKYYRFNKDWKYEY